MGAAAIESIGEQDERFISAPRLELDSRRIIDRIPQRTRSARGNRARLPEWFGPRSGRIGPQANFLTYRDDERPIPRPQHSVQELHGHLAVLGCEFLLALALVDQHP
jgi:hypothetical protein